MRNRKRWVLVPAVLILAAACGRGESASKVDEGLKNDLALASQMSPYQPQQFVSPMEAGQNGYAPYGQQYPGMAPQGYYPQPVYQPAPQPVAQRATVRRAGTTPARRSTGASRPVYREPTVKRNTKRDAAIGAAAGAAIGAASSRDKLKGAVIGAAAGGLLGGIIGHTVDVERTP